MIGHLQRKALELAKKGVLTSELLSKVYGYSAQKEANKMMTLGWIEKVKGTYPIKFKITKLGEEQLI